MSVAGFVSISMNIADALAGLAGLEHPPIPKAFATLKTPMRFDQREHAQAKTGPEGSWAPRAASTVESYKHRKHHPKKLMGRLPTAVTYKVTPRALTGTSKAGWSQAHQDGATTGHGARLPARPFLWLSDKFLGFAEDVFAGVALMAFIGPRGLSGFARSGKP